MTTEMRKTGIDVVGDMPWGTHFCLFYETKEDMFDTVVSYCKAGLESQEFCLWVVSEPLREEDATQALKQVVPDLDRYLADHSIQIVLAGDWYLHGGTFDLKRVIGGWNEKVARASARGYAGVRVTGDTAWLQRHDWNEFCEYEEAINSSIVDQRLTVLCTYPLAACGAAEILDVVRTHQFAVAKRHGSWEVIETPAVKQAKAEIKRLNEELEQRVVERTSQLTAVNEELRKEILERKRAAEALRRNEAYLAEAQRLSHTGSFGWDAAGAGVNWSEELFRILEYDPASVRLTLDHVMRRVHPDDHARVRQVIEAALREGKGWDVDHRLRMPDAAVKFVHGLGRAVRDPAGRLEFVGAVMDVTERKRAEQALRRARERALKARFAAVLEERTRLAREIHDTLLQGFTGIGLRLAAAATASGVTGPPEITAALRDVVTLVQRTLADARRAVWDLRAPAFEGADFSAALRTAAEERVRGAGLALVYDVEGSPRALDAAVEAVLSRVAQEAVANVVKHAAARTVRLSLAYQARYVCLSVADDGLGFVVDPDLRSYGGHWGLLGLRERASEIGADLAVRSALGQGAEVVLRAPYVAPRRTRARVTHRVS
jgi:PAS domain S-box-containing protein